MIQHFNLTISLLAFNCIGVNVPAHDWDKTSGYKSLCPQLHYHTTMILKKNVQKLKNTWHTLIYFPVDSHNVMK